MSKQWVNVCNPGYFGAGRDKKYREYDVIYGEGNWRIAWRAGSSTVDFLGACALYEEAYVCFFQKNPAVLYHLIYFARDVYDDAETNVLSGMDYTIQETSRTHIQDIAIRRAVAVLGKKFQGLMLIQIRDHEGKHQLSKTLSPGRVPFHKPQLILPAPPERRKPWWQPGSVEDFYQNNKVLQALIETDA